MRVNANQAGLLSLVLRIVARFDARWNDRWKLAFALSPTEYQSAWA